MDVIQGARTFLLAQSQIAALVSTRAYSPILPQKVTMPAIQLQLIDDLDSVHFRGPMSAPYARVQVDSWATTRDGASALGALCRQRLNGFKGEWSSADSPSTVLKISVVRYEDGSDRFEEDILGGVCRHSADYRIRYRIVEEPILI